MSRCSKEDYGISIRCWKDPPSGVRKGGTRLVGGGGGDMSLLIDFLVGGDVRVENRNNYGGPAVTLLAPQVWSFNSVSDF